MVTIFVTGMFAENNRETLDGMSGYVFKMAKQLKMRNIKVIIVAPGSTTKTWIYKGIDIHTVCVHKLFDTRTDIGIILQAFYRDYKLQKEIKKIRKSNKIDLIQYTGWYGIGILHKPEVPSVLRVSSYTKVQLSCIKTKQEIRCFSFLERLAAKNKTGIIAPSYAVGKAFEKDIGRKVTIIETPFWDEIKDKYDDRLYCKVLKGKKYILYFGRMTKDKGIYEIGQILERVLSERENIYFCFVGNTVVYNGENVRSVLQKSAGRYQNRIIFINKLSHEQLYPVIQNACMVLIPSRMDNFPNSCAEAMNFGKIVIGTNGTSLEQFITDGVNGFLAKPENADSLYQKVVSALNLSEPEKLIMEENAKSRIKKLSPDIMVPRLICYYNRIMREK